LDPRFPAQHPFEVIDELLAFTGAQLGRQRYVMPQTLYVINAKNPELDLSLVQFGVVVGRL
jgi:hypothetical protein